MNKSIKEIISTTAYRYIQLNPVEETIYRPWLENDFRQDEDGLYEFNFNTRFPESKNGDVCYILTVLESNIDDSINFSFNPMRDCEIYINDTLVAKTTYPDEANPKRKNVKLQLKKGRNRLFIKCRKNNIGFGVSFGEVNIRWGTTLYYAPFAENIGKLGFMYTKPFSTDVYSKPSEFPDIDAPVIDGWQGSKTVTEGNVLYAAFENEKEINKLCGVAASPASIYINGELAERVKAGSFCVCRNMKRGSEIVIEAASAVEITEPCATKAPEPFRASKIAVLRSKAKIKVTANFAQTYSKLCWTDGYDGGYFRAIGTDTNFAKATYPSGVALYGLYRAGKALCDEKITEYVTEHIKVVADLQEKALWEKEHYGVPLVNRQPSCIDCLDDCGSFSNAILECYEGQELPKNEERLILSAAQWMESGQERLSNGMFYRLKEGHNHYNTIWADDLFMSVPFLLRYYKRYNDKKMLQDAVLQIKCFYDKLYMKNKKLMSHVYSITHSVMTDVPWGRGNGWVIFTLSEILQIKDLQPSDREFLLEFFQELSQGILQNIGSDYMWHQITDDSESYAETSSTAMFICAFARGIKNGWLTDEKYKECVKKSTNELFKCSIEENGDVIGVCRGSGYSFRREYYKYELTDKRNDVHGIGIVLLAGVEADSI